MEYATAHIQDMQKALMELNLQLHHVVSDITRATGMRIIRATVAGERSPDVLATYRDVRCHSSIETIRAALVGNDRHEHVFALTQSLELYDVYQAKMLDCDRKLEVLIAGLNNNNKGAKPVGKLSKPRIKNKQVNTPTFDVRTALCGSIEACRGVWHRSEGMAERQALHLLAVPCARQQNLWWQGAFFTYPKVFESGSRTVAAGSHNRWQKRYSARHILSSASLMSGQVESRDGDRPQNCGFVLQRTPAWDELQRSGCRPL